MKSSSKFSIFAFILLIFAFILNCMLLKKQSHISRESAEPPHFISPDSAKLDIVKFNEVHNEAYISTDVKNTSSSNEGDKPVIHLRKQYGGVLWISLGRVYTN